MASVGATDSGPSGKSKLGSSHDRGRIVRLESLLEPRFGATEVFRYEFLSLIQLRKMNRCRISPDLVSEC